MAPLTDISFISRQGYAYSLSTYLHKEKLQKIKRRKAKESRLSKTIAWFFHEYI